MLLHQLRPLTNAHDVRLMPPVYVKAYVKRNKTDAADAEATRVKKWSWLKAWAMNVAKRGGLRKAIVALTRRLAVIMHRMWTDGTEFRWTRETTAIAI